VEQLSSGRVVNAAFSVASVLRLCWVYAASVLRLRHFDEMDMFNFPASACSNFKLLLQLRLCYVCAGSEKRSIDAAQTQL
jgi:hypothetical protein